MQPSESSIYPDLVLSVSSMVLDQYRDMILGEKGENERLIKGDEVEFKARFVSLGNEFKMHHLHLMELKATGEHDYNVQDVVILNSSLP